jgi:hypothetical protein
MIMKIYSPERIDEYLADITKKKDPISEIIIMDIEHAKIVDITDFLGKEFFNNGPEWKHGKYTMYNGITATDIKDIVAEKNMFKIIIENNTYKNIRKKAIYLDMEYFALYNENNDKIFFENYNLEF